MALPKYQELYIDFNNFILKAKMAAKKADPLADPPVDSPVDPQVPAEEAVPVETTPKTTPVVAETKPEQVTPIAEESVSANSGQQRRSIKQEVPQTKYSLRNTTRRSDLIKFESPAQSRSPKTVVTKGIFTLPNFESTIVESNVFDVSGLLVRAVESSHRYKL